MTHYAHMHYAHYATDTIFIDLLCITLTKLHVKFQPHPLKDFLSTGRKSAKNA